MMESGARDEKLTCYTASANGLVSIDRAGAIAESAFFIFFHSALLSFGFGNYKLTKTYSFVSIFRAIKKC